MMQIKRVFLTPRATFIIWVSCLGVIASLLSGCQVQDDASAAGELGAQVMPNTSVPIEIVEQTTPVPTRPAYSPGELVDYLVQTGDTLPALASRFNTSIPELREANPIIPENVTTLPPGMPMKIPIYYVPLWGTPYQILPDSHFINGPHQLDFDTSAFLNGKPGWLGHYVGYASGENRTGAEIVDLVAQNFSVSPRLLLALLEYQVGGVTQSVPPGDLEEYVLGNDERKHRGFYLQLVWAANTLNNHYYAWRSGELEPILHLDGTLERPDPWQNAATVALQKYFTLVYSVEEYSRAVNADGYAAIYRSLFGDPWENDQAHIPGSLTQPEMTLPFEPGETWAFTGGPHTGWGSGAPFAALDFAPPSYMGGCIPNGEWVTAVASGLVVRSETGIVVLDLDGDGDERTGWVIFYLHVASDDRTQVGTMLEAGGKVGHPSCEGGTSTGSHVHIARKYNGEWILADGPLAFNLEGWIAHNGDQPYLGTMTRFSHTVTACICSDGDSFITPDERE